MRYSLIIICIFALSFSVALVDGNPGHGPDLDDDPLIRMPGTQPDQHVSVEGPSRCLNCHDNYDPNVDIGSHWKGSMMAQAGRDPIFFASMAVAGQDSIFAVGTPHAADMCERCHFPEGWLAGRSDPPNASSMTGSDFDGVHCDVCHQMWNPFFEATHDGSREGSDWSGYWDEASMLSQQEADLTYAEDAILAAEIERFAGTPFFQNRVPVYATYLENGGGQYFVSSAGEKRASFADSVARHAWRYSRYHKSKYFCSTCHDVSNAVLANLGLSGLPDQSGGADLITEQYPAHRYFHVERTFSEFMLSDYSVQGGAAPNDEFQNRTGIAWVATCQDCHMPDGQGAGCDKNDAPIRPDESTEHPNSGMPRHHLAGGNTWITHILASLDSASPLYDPINFQLLTQGPDVLTVDFSVGESPLANGAALSAGSARALEQLQAAASIEGLTVAPSSGALSLKLVNHTGHKLISGFPEGRRMFLNIKAFRNDVLVKEINPYSFEAGTLKGLTHSNNSPPLEWYEEYVDELVYEVHSSSDLTGEETTFHIALATSRSKDNRIPPRGFDVDASHDRLCEPVWNGQSAPDYFTDAEYQGGFDQVNHGVPAGVTRVEVTLYYQGTSREYIEFLRDEINGNGGTLPDDAYVIQTDPFFEKLKAWGDTIWSLWEHNHGLDNSGVSVPGIVPVIMAQATWIGPTSGVKPVKSFR